MIKQRLASGTKTFTSDDVGYLMGYIEGTLQQLDNALKRVKEQDFKKEQRHGSFIGLIDEFPPN
jgi:capsule polysaccharide export protein KpsE/RkpR